MRRKILAGLAATIAMPAIAVGVATPASAQIRLYQYAGYGGVSYDVNGSTNYVGDAFNDRTSSLKVISPSNYAVLWQHSNWTGVSTQKFFIGWDNLAVSGYSTSDGSLMDDRTSSVS